MVVALSLYFHTETDFLVRRASIPFASLCRGFAMKKWLVVVLVVLALLLLVAPGIVGRLAENNIEQNIEWAERDSPAVNIETERFERGWFTSEGRHRIVLDQGQFREIAEDYREATGNAALPSLIIDTRLEHGPLPGGSFSPGLASSVSTFMIDEGDGQPIEINGELQTRVGLGGTSHSRLLLEEDSITRDGVSFEWAGTDLTIESNPSTGAVSATGEMQPWRITAEDFDMGIDGITIDADQVRSDYGFNVGTIDVAIGEITIEEEGVAFSMAGMRIVADTAVDGDRVNARSDFELDAMTVPAVGTVDFDMKFALTGADAASAVAIGTAIQDAQGAVDPEAALAGIYPEIEDDLAVLFQRGFSMQLETLDISLPQGVISSQLEIDVPETDVDAPFDWSSVMLRSTGKIDIRIPGPIYELAAMMNEQAGALVAMGILVQDGDDYVMNAEYAQGLFNVNGAPMPIPMPQ